MTKEKIERVRALLATLEDCERECHAVGFHAQGHLLNQAKSSVGWEFANLMERCSIKTASGEQK